MSDFLLPDAPELFDVGDDDDDEDDDSSDDDEFGLSDIDAAELRIDDESDEEQSTEGNSVEQVTRSVDSRHDVLQEAAQLANVESQAHPTGAKSATLESRSKFDVGDRVERTYKNGPGTVTEIVMENDVFSGFVKVLFEGESDEDIISERVLQIASNDSEEEANTSASMAQNSSNTSMPTRSGVAPSSSSSSPAPSELPQQNDVPQNTTAPEREAKAPLAVPELKSPGPTPKTPRDGDGGGIADSKNNSVDNF